MSNFSKTFCVLPWMHSFINTSGEYQICCSSDSFDNKIRKSDGRELTINNNVTENEVLNSETLISVRKAMLEGQWPEACTRCKNTEEGGGCSPRQKENAHFEKLHQELIDNTNTLGVLVNPKILSLDYRLGNSCNLSCAMCSPHYSKSLITNWNKISLDKINEQDLSKLKHSNWENTAEIVEKFSRISNELIHLHFAGGEPFVNNQVENLLKVAINNKISENIELSFNTNLTRIPSWTNEVFNKFKSVNLYCSIDAIGGLGEYIRRGSNWTDIDKNLKYIDLNFSKLNLKECIVNVTVQAQNIYKIDEIFDYLKQFQNISKSPYLTNLYYPSYLSTQILDKKVKELVEIKLGTIKGNSEVNKNIAEIISFMNSGFSFGENMKFYKFTKRLDSFSKNKLFELVPELNSDTIDI